MSHCVHNIILLSIYHQYFDIQFLRTFVLLYVLFFTSDSSLNQSRLGRGLVSGSVSLWTNSIFQVGYHQKILSVTALALKENSSLVSRFCSKSNRCKILTRFSVCIRWKLKKQSTSNFWFRSPNGNELDPSSIIPFNKFLEFKTDKSSDKETEISIKTIWPKSLIFHPWPQMTPTIFKMTFAVKFTAK